jgi:FkbM family methyltransferase
MTEAILRLADPGDTALDIGAHIGYTALLFARRVGPKGRIIAFEPAPDALPMLRKNVQEWANRAAQIHIEPIAISDHDGFSVFDTGGGHLSSNGNGRTTVRTVRLDSLDLGHIDIVKVDVEGYEDRVFAGAANVLGTDPPRDIVFEEHADYPADSHLILERCGYRIFRLTRSFWGTLLRSPDTPSYPAFMPSNFLATRDVQRAKQRFAKRGWMALRRHLDASVQFDPP